MNLTQPRGASFRMLLGSWGRYFGALLVTWIYHRRRED